MKILNCRHAVYTSADSSTVDLEIETDLYGWIPTSVTISTPDQEPHVLEIKQWLVANESLISGYIVDPQFAKDRKLEEIESVFTQTVSQIKSGYTADEIESWEKQEREARAFVLNTSANVPLLDSMTGGDESLKPLLVDKIISKSDAYAAVYGPALTNMQQRKRVLEAIDLNEDNATELIAAI